MRPRSSWPLVGRAAALRVITESAERPDVEGVVVVGPPGVGRTRLAKEAVTKLAVAGHPASWATGTRAAGTIALGALLHLAPPGDALGTFARIVERFSTPGGKRPVLVVDDAHLLDSASAALIFQLAVHTHTFVLLTVRQGQAAPDVITALWKERVARRVELLPLADDEIDAVLERGLGGPLDAVTKRTFRRLSAGNPLVLYELVQSALEGETLRNVDGLWHLDGTLQVTGRLGDLVEAQMDVDDAAVLSVLEVLACKEPLSQPVLEAITGHAAVVQTERRGLVMLERTGQRLQTRLSIPAYAGVIRARMPRARYRAIWENLAESLGKTPRRRADDVLELAVARHRAGLGSSVGELLAGARQAAEHMEFDMAERLAMATRDAGGGVDADLTLAEVLAWQGRYEAAAGILPEPEECPDEESSDRRAMLQERIEYWHREAAPAGGHPTGERAAEAVSTWIILLEGHVARSIAVGTALLAPPDPHLPARATTWAATAVMVAAGLAGDRRLVDQAAATGLHVATEHRNTLPRAQAQVRSVRCVALVLAGALADAAEAVEAGYEEALQTQLPQLVGIWTGLRGIVAKAQGRMTLAQQALRESIVLLEGHDPLRLQRLYLSELVGAHAMAGDTAGADQWLARMEDSPAPPGALVDPWINRNRAWAAVAALDLPHAVERAVTAAKEARKAGAPLLEAHALADACRMGGATTVRDRLTELSTTTPTPVTRAFAAMATAYATEDPDLLLESAVVLHRLGHMLAGAECAATSYRLLVAAGRRTAAKNAQALATELLADCGGARTPQSELSGGETALTPRELQIAKLVVSGLSGRAVAERLDLSLRTVNNHLGRVYTKLGVSGRQALADVLSHAPE
ncbi:helix-turn-helix transcriptional regulator [Herbidospora mongoliensis]|uniref:helix-turn-helix transcriptional regulator n=1 Tax=Herbidospora mongoliensis TaxID=688067 RepID=UPI0012FA2DDD|nr:helix-turn-helix transcriptional regulator [Herbidospora mongoliensis]